jgi:NAD-dependent SIR2 family protein deacetylase
MKKMNKQDCETCYKIICKQCGWVASDEEVLKIQRGEMTVCPECGWSPA